MQWSEHQVRPYDTQATLDHVVASIGVDRVSAALAVQQVVAVPAAHKIIRVVGVGKVVARQTDDDVDVVPAVECPLQITIASHLV
jgi:hypothetical protein